jgi:hypothetical protein
MKIYIYIYIYFLSKKKIVENSIESRKSSLDKFVTRNKQKHNREFR